MRRRRQFAVGGALVLLLLIYFAFFSGGSSPPPEPATTHHAVAAAEHFPKHSPLNPDWTGNGKTVTLGFGGDVHFAGDVGERLAQDPSTALGTGIPQLFDGTQLKMVNVETAVTDGTCPEPQSKPYIFDAPASAVTALKSATVTVATEANDHGMDCGAQGLSQNLTIASQAELPHHRHRQHGGTGLRPLPGDDRRPAGGDHRGDAGDRRQPDQHVDGLGHPAGRRLGDRPDRARA